MGKATITTSLGDGEYDIVLDEGERLQPMTVWCADLTDDLSGEVGTSEIAGDTFKGVNIQPGYAAEGSPSPSIYDALRDGGLYIVPQSGGSQHSSGVYWNYAMLPGWQKWMPNYRYGKIGSIDSANDTCGLSLFPCYSEAEPDGIALDVNQVSSLKDVAIEYMNCNAAAFSEGDIVIVKFTGNDWASPVVIGFKEEPKACGFTFTLTHGDGTEITEDSGLLGSIKIYNSSEVLINTTTVWNADSEKWTVSLDDSGDADEDGYFAVYNTSEYGISTQYPYRYKTADKWNADDLIPVGEYSDTIPYWNAGGQTYNPLPAYLNAHPCPLTDQLAIIAHDGVRWIQTLSTFDINLTVSSSIQFKVTYAILPHYATNWKEDEEICSSYKHSTYTAVSNDGALNFIYTTHPSPGVVVDSEWTDGSVSGVEKSMTITVPEWTQMWIPFSTTIALRIIDATYQ